MCGLYGGIGVAETTMRRMGRALEHRGPDGEGTWTEPPFRIGLHRLAIIDPQGSRQPVTNEDATVVVACNGEIYNFRALKSDLQKRGHHFRTDGDTEVLVHGYEEWGREVVHRIEGMFAFALVDRRGADPFLFLARDRFGVKPLYHFSRSGLFLFSSEMRPLLGSGIVEPRLDPLAVWEYCGFQSTCTPRTMIGGIQMVPPGHWLVVDRRCTVDLHQYWTLHGANPTRGDSRSPESETRRLLGESVAAHLVADVPVAIFLSGGIDSAALAALVRESGHTPNTFTIGFSEQDALYDERKIARRVAEQVGAEHVEIVMTEDDCLQQIPAALAAMDHPTGDGINTFVVAKAVRNAGFKVALSGLGGDEVFGGYSTFARIRRLAPALRMWSLAPQPVKELAAGLIRFFGPRSITTAKIAAIASDGNLASAFSVLRQTFPETYRRTLFPESWAPDGLGAVDPYTSKVHWAFDKAHSNRVMAAVSYAETITYMHDVLLRDTDQFGMAHGLEVRVPFLDHKLVEYVFGLPDAAKRGSAGNKHLLIKSMGSLLPDAVMRPPKCGFVLPFDRWMRGPLRSFCQEHLARLGERTFFDANAVLGTWRAFDSGSKLMTWSRVWSLVALETWLSRHNVAP